LTWSARGKALSFLILDFRSKYKLTGDESTRTKLGRAVPKFISLYQLKKSKVCEKKSRVLVVIVLVRHQSCEQRISADFVAVPASALPAMAAASTPKMPSNLYAPDATDKANVLNVVEAASQRARSTNFGIGFAHWKTSTKGSWLRQQLGSLPGS
jgi:hypothetical protein